MTSPRNPKITVKDLSVRYGDTAALHDVSIDFYNDEVTALIGPSGCGKSTLLKCLNRMNDVVPDCAITGQITLDNQDIYADTIDVVHLRARVGMVFQQPNPFPKSIFDNVAYGPRIHGLARSQREMDDIVANALDMAGLWGEVSSRLNESALTLSGGQQQRLCIARAIALGPEVILMDEPCSSLDPIATARVENLIESLIGEYAIVIVTHSMQQAARISQQTAFMKEGRIIEKNQTVTLFTRPENTLTRDYITGRFGAEEIG